MRVFFRFGDAQLVQAELGQIFAERIGDDLRRERDLYIRNGRVVLRHADISEILHLPFTRKAVEVRIHKGAGQFSGAIRAEVAEDDAVAVLYGQRTCIIFAAAESRFDKLIGFSSIVSFLHRFVSRSS